MKKYKIKSLPKAQVGIEKEQYLDPAYVYPTEKKRKKFGDLMDQVKAFGNTFAGRIVDKENLYPDRSMQSLQQYIQDVKEYQKQAAEYQKARRLVKQKKMSTDSFADRYESNNWARFDKNVRRNTAEEQAELVDTWYGGINPIHVAQVAKVVAGAAPLAPFVLPVAAPVLTSALTNPLVQAGLTGYGVYDATTNSIPEAYRDFSEGRYLEGIGNTAMAALDLAPIPLFGTNLIDEAVDAGKYINRGYNKIATGNSRLPVAWKMENVSNVLKPVKNKFDLTDEEAFILGKYIETPYNIQRGSRESEIFDQMIKRNPAILEESNSVITKVLNHSTQTDKDFVPTKWGSQFTFPGNRSWSLGVDPRFADSGRTRLVIPSKYNKDVDFMAVDYSDPRIVEGINAFDNEQLNRAKELLNKTTDPSEINRLNEEIKRIEEGIKNKNFTAENELIGNIPEGYKVIGRSTEGGFDNIFIKPVKVPKNNIDLAVSKHNVDLNPNIVYKESSTGEIVPFNEETGKTLQQEYVDELKAYYDSPEFKRIMKEEYPDVDIDQYKKVTLENLEKELTYNPSKVPENSSGVYNTKRSSDAVYVPGHRPTLKQRVANANTNPYAYQNDNGLSFFNSPSAAWHELSHQRSNSAELLPDWLTRSLLEEKALPMADDLAYHAKPTEFEVRLRQLKKDIKEQGIKDYFEAPISAEDILALDAVKLKEQGMDLLRDFKPKYRALKNAGASESELKKAQDEYFTALENLEKNAGDIKTSGDTQDLLDRWSPEFLAEMARKIPGLIPAAGAAGAIGLMGSQTESKEPFSTFRPNYQTGGSIELELTPKEIQWYLDNGYNVEEVSDYQDGGEIISSNGWDYKKEGDQYFTRKTGTSQWMTPTGNALTAIKQKVFNELPYTAADRRADYLKNLETLVNQGYTIDDLVNMGMGTKAGLTSILGTTETATPQVSETVNPVQQKSYWDPYNYGNKYTMTGIEQPSFNLDMSSVNNFALSKEPENVAYAKELRKEGKALTPTEQQAFDINYDPYQMAVDRFTMPRPVYNQEVFTAREKLPVSNYWNPMFATYAEAMGQVFNPEVPEYSNQQSTLDRAFEVAKMFGDKESIVPQEQSLPINYDPRMSAQKDAEYRAARNFWDNKTKDLEDANALFDKETLYSVQDYKKNWPAYAKRYLTKKGYLKPDAVETDYEDTKQKIKEKPRVDTFFEKLESSQDKHYQNTTGAKLMKFRHQWDGDEGFTYYVTKPKGLDRDPSETYENVEGVGHFALDANPLKGSTNIHRNNFNYVRNNILNDEYIPIYKQSLEKNKINMSYKKPSEMTPEEVKALDIFKKYDEKFKKATSARMKDQVAKEYAEEIDDSNVKIVEPLRQVAFDSIDFNSGKKAPTFKSAKYIQTKDGKETKLLYTNPSKKAYGRFDGAGVSFIFKDKYGNTIVRDFAGSIVDIQEEGKNIKKQYNLKDGDLIVGYHDVGSFSAKPVAQDGKLRISDFDIYNDSPGTGTALIIPSSPQTPLLNEFYK